MPETLRFDGRVALITGAGSGMGRAHSLLLASRGAKVVVNELPETIERAEAVVAEISAAGGEAVVAPGRVGVNEDAQAMVARAVDSFGRIDIVVNNAGIPAGDENDVLVQNAPTERLEKFLDIHVRGPLQINRAAWPHMVASTYGRIIFVGSAMGTGWFRSPLGYEIDYSAAKAAVLVIARQTAGAGMEHNIKANTLMPWAYTRMVSDTLGGTELGAWMESNLRSEQVVNAASYLLHEECPVTGEAITAQGGRVGRVFFAATTGYFNPDLTPEDVRDNWAVIEGKRGADGTFLDIFEQTQASEERLVAAMLESGKLPDLNWLLDQPIKAAAMSTTK